MDHIPRACDQDRKPLTTAFVELLVGDERLLDSAEECPILDLSGECSAMFFQGTVWDSLRRTNPTKQTMQQSV